MTDLQSFCLAGTVLTALGLWLLLPRGKQGARAFGAVLTAVGLGLLASRLPGLGEWGDDVVFYLIAGVTVVSAVATVTAASPVYSAIWFALTLLGTAGLFLFQGAQFLGVATIVVYAGAILVTFLFVLMLAHPSGTAFYDRLSWEAPLSAAAGAVMIGILTLAMASVFQPASGSPPESVQTADARDRDVLASQHMAHLGRHLFSEHLVSIEIAGTLLLVALVGCIAIVSQIRHAGADPFRQGGPGSRRRSEVSPRRGHGGPDGNGSSAGAIKQGGTAPVGSGRGGHGP